MNILPSCFEPRTHRISSALSKTEILRHPMLRLCQALMLILAASVCSGQTVTSSIKINLTIDGMVVGSFTEIKGIIPQLDETFASSSTTPIPTTKIVLRRRLNNELMVSSWYSTKTRRSIYLTVYDYTLPVARLWLENALPVSLSYSTEVEAGRIVVVETVVFDYTAMQRVAS